MIRNIKMRKLNLLTHLILGGSVLFSGQAFAQDEQSSQVLVGEVGKKISAYVPCDVADPSCRSEKLQKVEISSFYIDRYEATYAEIKACYEDGRCSNILSIRNATQNYDEAKAKMPFNLGYEDAEMYCKARGMRLPEPAEWLLAAMGTEVKDYPWGNDKIKGMYADELSDVGSFSRDVSVWGVYDMAGNAVEWVTGEAMGVYDLGVKCIDERTRPCMGNARRVKIYEQFGVQQLYYYGLDDAPGVRCVKDID